MSLTFTCPACSGPIETRVSESVTKCSKCLRSFRLQPVRRPQLDSERDSTRGQRDRSPVHRRRSSSCSVPTSFLPNSSASAAPTSSASFVAPKLTTSVPSTSSITFPVSPIVRFHGPLPGSVSSLSPHSPTYRPLSPYSSYHATFNKAGAPLASTIPANFNKMRSASVGGNSCSSGSRGGGRTGEDNNGSSRSSSNNDGCNGASRHSCGGGSWGSSGSFRCGRSSIGSSGKSRGGSSSGGCSSSGSLSSNSDCSGSCSCGNEDSGGMSEVNKRASDNAVSSPGRNRNNRQNRSKSNDFQKPSIDYFSQSTKSGSPRTTQIKEVLTHTVSRSTSVMDERRPPVPMLADFFVNLEDNPRRSSKVVDSEQPTNIALTAAPAVVTPAVSSSTIPPGLPIMASGPSTNIATNPTTHTTNTTSARNSVFNANDYTATSGDVVRQLPKLASSKFPPRSPAPARPPPQPPSGAQFSGRRSRSSTITEPTAIDIAPNTATIMTPTVTTPTTTTATTATATTSTTPTATTATATVTAIPTMTATTTATTTTTTTPTASFTVTMTPSTAPTTTAITTGHTALTTTTTTTATIATIAAAPSASAATTHATSTITHSTTAAMNMAAAATATTTTTTTTAILTTPTRARASSTSSSASLALSLLREIAASTSKLPSPLPITSSPHGSKISPRHSPDISPRCSPASSRSPSTRKSFNFDPFTTTNASVATSLASTSATSMSNLPSLSTDLSSSSFQILVTADPSPSVSCSACDSTSSTSWPPQNGLSSFAASPTSTFSVTEASVPSTTELLSPTSVSASAFPSCSTTSPQNSSVFSSISVPASHMPCSSTTPSPSPLSITSESSIVSVVSPVSSIASSESLAASNTTSLLPDSLENVDPESFMADSVHAAPPPEDDFEPEKYWHEVAESIVPLRKGELFTWVAEENGIVRLSEVFVYMVPGPPDDVKSSTLHWCPPGTRTIIPGQSLRLRDITEMLQGCPPSLRPSSSRTASKLIKNRCFTLFARKATYPTLTMETEEKKICIHWLTCLHRVLINADRNVDGESRKITVARRHSSPARPASQPDNIRTSPTTASAVAGVQTSPSLSSSATSIIPPLLRPLSRDKSLSASNCAQISQLLEQQSSQPDSPKNGERRGDGKASPSFFSRMLQRGRRKSSSRSSSQTRSRNSRSSISPSRTVSVTVSMSSQNSSKNQPSHNIPEDLSPKNKKNKNRRRNSLPWRSDNEPVASKPPALSVGSNSPPMTGITTPTANLLSGAKRVILRRASLPGNKYPSSEITPSRLQVLSGDELALALEKVRKGDGFVRHLSKETSKAVSLYVRDNKLVCRSGEVQEALIPLIEGVNVYAGKQAFPPDWDSSSSATSPTNSSLCFSVVSGAMQLHLEANNLPKGELWMNALHTILLKQKAARVAVASVKRDPNFAKVLEFMKEGSIVTQYHVPTEGPPIVQTVTMFYSDGNQPELMGNLFWVQTGTPREERARNCFPIEHIMEMTLGKASRALLTVADKADDRCCFTISPAKGKSLNLETESCGKRALWVQGINFLLTASKQVKKIPAKGDSASTSLPAEAQVFTRFQLVDGASCSETIRMWYRASTGRLGHLLWAVVLPLTPIADNAPPLSSSSPVSRSAPTTVNQQLALSSITEITLGSQTSGFGEVPVDPGCCFTIFTAHHKLELCAKTPALRDIWLSQLHQLLTSSGVIAKRRSTQSSRQRSASACVASSSSSHFLPSSPASGLSAKMSSSSNDFSSCPSGVETRNRSLSTASCASKSSGSSSPRVSTSAISTPASATPTSTTLIITTSGASTTLTTPATVPTSVASLSVPTPTAVSASGRQRSASASVVSKPMTPTPRAPATPISCPSTSSKTSIINKINDNSSTRPSAADSGPISSVSPAPSESKKRSPRAVVERIATPPKVSELKSASITQRAVDFLGKGTLFDEYQLDDRQGTTITEVMVCYCGPVESGHLTWGPPQVDPSEFTSRLSLSALTLVSCGKKSPAFLSRGGRKAKDESCFGLHSAECVLSLEADTRESRSLWLHELQILLTNTGKQIPFQTDDPTFGEPVAHSPTRKSSTKANDRFGVVNEMPTVLMRPPTAPGLAFDQQDPSLIFTILAKIGQGSFGAVYRAQDHRDNRIVGLKLMECDADSTDEIQKEIKILQSCASEYIVALYGVYHKEASIWIAMEYCAAGSLADMMTVCRQTLCENQIAVVMRMALLGLQYLHGRQILHRDIKAANLLMTESGHCKLADFGVSAEISALTHRAQTVIGTPNWMAPEVIRASYYNDRADIWSLGITAIELAVGKPPHSDVQAMTAMFRIPTAPAPTLPHQHLWSANFHAFLKSCLQKDFGLRPSAESLLNHPFVATALDIAPLKQFVDRCMLEMKSFRELNEGQPNPLAETNVSDPGSSTLRYSSA